MGERKVMGISSYMNNKESEINLFEKMKYANKKPESKTYIKHTCRGKK